MPGHQHILDTLIETAIGMPEIVAVAAYGSTATGAWSPFSDLDLMFIISDEAPVNSLHFFIDGIPIDLGLKGREAWSRGEHGWLPPEPLKPLWDPEGLFVGVDPPPASTSDALQYRYAHRHRLMKLNRWIGRDEEIADLLAAGATHWIAVSWFHARQTRFPGIDKAVEHWRANDPEMIDLLIGAARDREGRLERITRASEIALAPVGGLWSEGEIHMTGVQGEPTPEQSAAARALLLTILDAGGWE
jgi:predicted nucleotidyltransferase